VSTIVAEDSETARSLGWAGRPVAGLGRTLALGALVWAAYSTAQVCINGLVVDEIVEPAQIIAGLVHYPAGHPHQIFYPKIYCLPQYLGAAVLAAIPNPLPLSAIRNFLFLLLSTFVPFAAAVVLTRRALWGYLAGALTVCESLTKFQGAYPLWVFPFGYSNGHVGMYTAVLTVILMLAGMWRTGGFLLGALPSVHAAMALAAWAWSLCYFFWTRARELGKARGRLILAICLGLAVCVAFAAIIHMRTANATVAPPYDEKANGDLIYQRFSSFTDTHRRPFPILSLGYLVNPIAFFVLGGLLLWTGRPGHATGTDGRACAWLLLLGAGAWAYVYGTRLIELLGVPLPSFIYVSMPARFSNISAILLIPLTVAALASALEVMGETERPVATALLVSLLAMAAVYEAVNRTRAVSHLMFMTWGLLFALDVCAHRGGNWRGLGGFLGLALVGGAAMVLPHRTHVVSLVASFLVSYLALAAGVKVLHRFQPGMLLRWNSSAGTVLLAGCFLTSAAALPRRVTWEGAERWDRISNFDRQLNEWLATNSRPDEVILSPICERCALQAKTMHPVLMEPESLWIMSYMKSLAPVIGMMSRDLFGIDYTNLDQLEHYSLRGYLGVECQVWLEAWKRRKLDEWQALGRKYQFRLVLSPSDTALDLPAALRGPTWTLYVIPNDS
jgi:hypothetical protein